MQTKVFFTGIGPLRDERVYRRMYDPASEGRKTKTDRYRFLEDRMRSLCAEGLLRYAWEDAGHSLPLPSFFYGKNGKPYLSGNDGFFFNLSHSGEYVMLAVSNTEIGCDIERIRPVDGGLAGRVLTPEEYRAFEVCSEAERDELFCRYWVAKESFLKACGNGLPADPASVRIVFGPPVCAVGEAYAFREGSMKDYRYAVCRKGSLSDPQIITVQIEEMIGGNT